jgi:hypothetical protein
MLGQEAGQDLGATGKNRHPQGRLQGFQVDLPRPGRRLQEPFYFPVLFHPDFKRFFSCAVSRSMAPSFSVSRS